MPKDNRPTFRPNVEALENINEIMASDPLKVKTTTQAIQYALRFTAANDEKIKEKVERDYLLGYLGLADWQEVVDTFGGLDLSSTEERLFEMCDIEDRDIRNKIFELLGK